MVLPFGLIFVWYEFSLHWILNICMRMTKWRWRLLLMISISSSQRTVLIQQKNIYNSKASCRSTTPISLISSRPWCAWWITRYIFIFIYYLLSLCAKTKNQQGFRLIAISLLPISHNTLCYGRYSLKFFIRSSYPLLFHIFFQIFITVRMADIQCMLTHQRWMT